MRHWKTLSTSFATLCARLSSTAAMLVVNGIANRRMTPEQFGLLAILLSLMQLSTGLDFGFRFTLGNRLAALGSRGAEAENERRETFLSIFFLQVAIAVAGALLVLLLCPLAPWEHWFKITNPLLITQVRHLMPIVIILMIGCLPVALMWTVFFAYLEIKLASFLTLGCNLLQTTIFVVSAYRFDFTWVILIYFAFNVIQGVVLTAYVFIHRKWKFSYVPPGRILAIARSMARVSFHAFFLTIAGIMSMILGPIISGAVSGLAAAGTFTLFQKLFSFLVTAHLAILAPVSPAITMESHAGNWDTVRRRLRVCVLQVLPPVFLVLGAVVLWFHPLLLHLWAGHPIPADYPLAALLLVWACFMGFGNTFSVFLNSLGLVKVQAAMAFTMLIPSLLLPALMSRWLGVPGIAISMVLCTLPAVIVLPIYTRRALRLHMLRV